MTHNETHRLLILSYFFHLFQGMWPFLLPSAAWLGVWWEMLLHISEKQHELKYNWQIFLLEGICLLRFLPQTFRRTDVFLPWWILVSITPFAPYYSVSVAAKPVTIVTFLLMLSHCVLIKYIKLQLNSIHIVPTMCKMSRKLQFWTDLTK